MATPSIQLASASSNLQVLLFILRWLVEGQPQGDDGGHLEDDERHVLQRLPHQLQEGLGRLGRYHIGAKDGLPVLQVTRLPAQALIRSRSCISDTSKGGPAGTPAPGSDMAAVGGDGGGDQKMIRGHH
ncbi:hypothetical protein TYRP_012271 [Tyrophagus putrescentiae]|nr:hypothetical protein TYRP_012271 [Tyrophagus putrescentiae]